MELFFYTLKINVLKYFSSSRYYTNIQILEIQDIEIGDESNFILFIIKKY